LVQAINEIKYTDKRDKSDMVRLKKISLSILCLILFFHDKTYRHSAKHYWKLTKFSRTNFKRTR
jgi:hypothetical protein